MARKTGIIAGILTLVIAFFYKIPVYPPMGLVLNFKLFTLGNIDYCVWGNVIKAGGGLSASSLITLDMPESLVAVSLWVIIFLIGLNSIMASTTKAKLSNSLKLYWINIVLIVLILFLYGLNILFLNQGDLIGMFIPIFNVLGLGYYSFILILILNILALKKVKKKIVT